MLTSTLSLSWSSLSSMTSPEKSANGPSLTRTVSPISYSRRGLARWATCSSVHEERLDVAAGQRRRLGALAHEAGHTRRVADDEPRLVVELGTHQQVAGEHLPLGHDTLAVAEVDVVLHGNDHFVDRVLGVHRHDARLEVLLDLLLVAGLGVHDEPATRPVVRALGGRPLEQFLGADHVDAALRRFGRLGRLGVGVRGRQAVGGGLGCLVRACVRSHLDRLVGVRGVAGRLGLDGVGLDRVGAGLGGLGCVCLRGGLVGGGVVVDHIVGSGLGGRLVGAGLGGGTGDVDLGFVGVCIGVTHRWNRRKMASPKARSRSAMYVVRITTVKSTMIE
jgi:hypothetical protein